MCPVYTFHNLKLQGRRKNRVITQKCGERVNTSNLGMGAAHTATDILEKSEKGVFYRQLP